MKANDLIAAALRTARITDPLEVPTSEEAAVGLAELNSLLETWDAETLLPYAERFVEALLPAGQTVYTIGPDVGADIVSDRPISITGLQRLGSSAWIALSELSVSDYANNVVDTLEGVPNRFVYNPTTPAGSIIMLPTPMAALTVRVTYQVKMTGLALDTDLAFPPGYAPAIQWDLARILAPMFHIPDTADIEREAIRRKAIIKRVNDQPARLGTGLAPLGRYARGRFDIRAGV